MDNVKCAPGKVLIRFVPKSKIGSIIIPDTAIERDRDVGIVEAVGAGIDWLSAGDHAYLSPDNLGASIPETDRKLVLFDVKDIWGSSPGMRRLS